MRLKARGAIVLICRELAGVGEGLVRDRVDSFVDRQHAGSVAGLLIRRSVCGDPIGNERLLLLV